jgi:hypothetical protein
VTYLKWKLSEGVSGTGPEGEIAERGGKAEAGWAVDTAGYRIGYLTQTAALTGLEAWDVTEQTEAQALTFCQASWVDAAVTADGRISSPPTPEDE